MRILVTEDDLNMLEFLHVCLKAERFEIDTAKTAENACRMARMRNYDLIVLDNRLPDGCAAEVCETLRCAGRKTPIIVVSVICDVAEKIALFKCGADDYLSKPFAFDELLARIRALLRRPPISEKSVIRIGDLQIDTVRHSVTNDGEEVYLTRKEFDVIEYLARNSGKYVSRETLMDRVWNEDCNPFSNTVEAHILNLRKKIGDTKRTIIENLPGCGYIMNAD